MKGISNAILLLGLVAPFSQGIAAPQDFWPQKAAMFYTTEQSGQFTRYAKRYIGENTPLRMFNIDEGVKFMQSLSNEVPKEVLKLPKDEIDAYIAQNIAPKMKENTYQLMQSKLGLSFAKMYGVEKVPAIVFDGHYIVYGLPMNEAIKKYQIYKDKEAYAK